MKYKHLVLEGGGIGAIAHLGALEELAKRGVLHDIHHFAGASAGALLAALIAMGFTPTELISIFATYPFNKVLNSGYIRMGWNLWKHFGLYSTDSIITALRDIIKPKQNPDMTFKELYETTGNFLVIVVSSINKQAPIYLNPNTHASVKIIDAIRSSIAIPLFFIPTPVSFACHTLPVSECVDGGFLDNFPIWIFDSESNMNMTRTNDVPDNTLGLKLVDQDEEHPLPTPTSIETYVLRLVRMITNQLENVVRTTKSDKQTINIVLPTSMTVSFDISEEMRQKLFQIGRDAANAYFN